MFNPKYRVLLTSKCFPENKFICLGRQLISLINLLGNFLPNHTWYGADVDAIGKGAMKHNLNNPQLSMIGTDSEFIKYCTNIQQFIWGVFVCIDSHISTQKIQATKLETEEEPFRPISCDGVLIEIRAFDTTFFDIYSENLQFIQQLSNIYDVVVEKK